MIVSLHYNDRDARSQWLHQNLNDLLFSLNKVLKRHHHGAATGMKSTNKMVIHCQNVESSVVESYITPFVEAMKKESFSLIAVYSGG